MTEFTTIVEYLNTISLTHEYLNTKPSEIPLLHSTIASFTQSPNVLKKYPINKETIINSQLYELLSTLNKGTLETDQDMIRFYIMQLRLELIMSEFTLASGTISRLKDLFTSIGIQEEVGPLVQVILLRSELLEVESFLSPDVVMDNDSNKPISIFDRLANIKNIVNNYIDSSSKVVIDSINRKAALSVTSSGLDAMRSSKDLYLLEKRKRILDKNIADLAVNFQNNDNVKLNPILAINESITALNELLQMRPLDAEVHMELANLYKKSGRFKEALWHVGEVLIIGCAGACNVWSLRGELCFLQSECENRNKGSLKSVKAWLSASIASFMYSIELNDDYVRSWCGLHVSLTKLANITDDLDELYMKAIVLKDEKLKKLQTDTKIPANEREHISWILDNYRRQRIE